jgi:hypothetical protein
MIMPINPHVKAASPSVAASPTTLFDDANNDEEGEAPVSSLYCRVYFKSEKAGLKDLGVLFVMAEGHNGLSFPKHTNPHFIERKAYVKKLNQTGRFCKLRFSVDSLRMCWKARSQDCQHQRAQHGFAKTRFQATMNSQTRISNVRHLSQQWFCQRKSNQNTASMRPKLVQSIVVSTLISHFHG